MSYRLVCSADFHQGDDCFHDLSKGRQCVANCMMFLIMTKMKENKKWSKIDLHGVLYAGDYIYLKLHQELNFKSTYLLPSELPEFVLFNGLVFGFTILKTYSGTLDEHFIGEYPLLPLQSAIQNIVHTCRKMQAYAILIVNANAVGIYFNVNTFTIFDPHARNENGLCCVNGTCVLGMVKSISELCLYLRTLFNTTSHTFLSVQYDLHNIHLSMSQKKSRKYCNARRLTIIPSIKELFNNYSTRESDKNHSFVVSSATSNHNKSRKRGNPDSGCQNFHNNKKSKSLLPKTKIQDQTLNEVHQSAVTTINGNAIDVNDCEIHENLSSVTKQNSFSSYEKNSCKTSSKNIQIIDLPFLDKVELTRSKNLQKKNKGFLRKVDLEKKNENNKNIVGIESAGIINFEKIVKFFKAMVLLGPEYVCSSCSQTFFKHSMMDVDKLKLSDAVFDLMSKCLTGTKSVSNTEWICLTCLNSIKSQNIPACSHLNDLKFPTKPPELELTPLEERLVAPRLPFMQIREMPRGGQLNIRGNVVNVPADVNNTVRLLPRFLNDTETIAVKFKRKLSYKHHVAFENIRPNKVLTAAKWLVENSVLFRNEGIKVDDTWLCNNQSTEQELSINENVNPIEDVDQQGKHVSDSDNWTENEDFESRPNGNLDTVLQPMDYREFNQILALAPGEGNTPLGLYQDTNSEFLSFPSIYCGQTRKDNTCRPVPLHYSTICKWELRNVDRRAALSIPAIFYKLKKLQIKQIKDKVGVAIRKCKTKGRKITAKEILSPSVLDQITKQDDGYKILRTLRGSPPYWEQAKKDLFAMIKQLGIPTWFCSFSAAETKWLPLLKCLAKLVNKKEATEEEIHNMSWQEKCNLIKSDPVTCARYFDYRVQSFILHVLQGTSKPVGDILDYFYRVEFQQRGSPHIHMLIWIKNAPLFQINDNKDIKNLLDKHVTCHKDSSMPTLVNYQTHRHARTCRKKGKAICRFNFPLPPMPETMILEPLDPDNQSVDLKKKHDSIIEFVNSNINRELSFEDFLGEVGLSLDQYLLCLRSALKVPTVYLKRSLNEVRINSYNTLLLKCWEANMDIQYILDPYACVSYIASYISKGQRGLSNLLYSACKESRLHDNNIQQQVRRVGNQFLTHVEVGAQEAVYLVLQMPLRRSTRDVVFIDTNPPDKRTALLKPFSDIKNLPKNSTNIEADNALKRYVRRPFSMQNCCYADFVSWFSVVFVKKQKETIVVENELPEIDYNYNLEDDIDHGHDTNDVNSDLCFTFDGNNEEFDVNCDPGTEFILLCGTVVKKRRNQRILRYNRTCLNVDSESHFRQLIMLFTSWRNEELDLLQGCSSYEESYRKQKNGIERKQNCYVKLGHNVDLDEALLRADHEIENNIPDTVLPQVQHLERLDSEQTPTVSEIYGCFNPGDGLSNICQYDIGQDIGVANTQLQCDCLPLNELPDEDYCSMVQELNEKQKQFFYHVLHLVKTKNNPFYLFLTGGAGVGKSVLLRSLYQGLLKFLNRKVGENPDELKILLCAPTGKAAHNIGGNTIHSSFCIPISKGFSFKPLDMQQLNILRSKYLKLKIIFIDEISMVGKNMFDFINLRLQEITGCTKPFGGISIIAVGDLFQLKPVMDSWIFSQPSSTCDIRCISSNSWVDHFAVYELDQIMRQKDDLDFAELLNRLRECNQTEGDIEKLKTRLYTRNDDNTIEKIPHLFTTRAESELHNKFILSTIPLDQKTTVTAIDTISGDLGHDLQRNIISRIPDDAAKTMGLHKSLCVGVDLPAELCLNINIEDGMTNGTPCTIMKLDFRVQNSQRCSIIWVQFDDVSVGSQWRHKYRYLYQNDIAKNWIPILESTRSFCMQYFKTYHVVRRQFPIQMAAAKTVHKSQGSTLSGAVVHFGKRKNDHMHYVGLSRVRNLTSLHILELNESKISVSESVKTEMERLRSTAPVNLCVPNLSHYFPPASLRITFHNCRSLHRHINDVRHDNLLLATDILVFCETRLLSSDAETYYIAGFDLQRKDETANCGTARPCHGMATYSRVDVSIILMETINGIELVVLKVLNNTVNFCFMYCPPKYATLGNFKIALDYISVAISLHEPTVIMGDFNQDLFQDRSIVMLMDKYKLQQLIGVATTDYGSCLDHIYANIDPRTMNTISLKDLFSNAKSNATPYQKSLKVTTVASGQVRQYTNDSGDKRECLNVAVADMTMATKLVIYEPKVFSRFSEGKTVLIRNIIKKPDGIVVTTNTRVFPTQPVEIPEDIRKSGQHIINPPPPPFKPIKEALKSPVKTRVSVKGKIVQEDAVQEVMVRNNKVQVKSIYLVDSSAKAKVSLWRDLSEVPFRAGDYVKITNVVVNTFRNDTSFSTTSVTTVEPTEAPEEEQLVNVISVAIEDTQVCLLTQEDLEISVPVELAQLACPEVQDLEKHLMDLCSPVLNCKLSFRGGDVVSFELQ